MVLTNEEKIVTSAKFGRLDEVRQYLRDKEVHVDCTDNDGTYLLIHSN